MSIRINLRGHAAALCAAGCKLGHTTIATTLSHCFPFPHQGEGRTNREAVHTVSVQSVSSSSFQFSSSRARKCQCGRARPHHPPRSAAAPPLVLGAAMPACERVLRPARLFPSADPRGNKVHQYEVNHFLKA